MQRGRRLATIMCCCCGCCGCCSYCLLTPESSRVSMLAQVHSLPRAERKLSLGDRDVQRSPNDRTLDVTRHVVGPLVGVSEHLRRRRKRIRRLPDQSSPQQYSQQRVCSAAIVGVRCDTELTSFPAPFTARTSLFHDSGTIAFRALSMSTRTSGSQFSLMVSDALVC